MTTTDNPTEVNERMINKVMRLLAKAESTTPEEAEALVAKATELMVRHEIDQAMIAEAKGIQVDHIIEKRIWFKGSYSVAQRSLMAEIGRAQGFKILQSNGYATDKAGYWIGFSKDIASAEILLTSLLIQQAREAAAYMKASRDAAYWGTAADRMVQKRSHMLGFADGAGSIVRKARRDATESAQTDYVAACPDSTTSVALVLKGKDEQVKDWYDTRYGKLKASRRGRSMNGSSSARNAGYAAGQRANIGGTTLGSQKGLGR